MAASKMIESQAPENCTKSRDQTGAFLTRLPQELRDLIYDEVFASNSEQKIPHPLIQTCQSVARESTLRLRRYFSPRTTLQIECRHASMPTSWTTSFYTSAARGDYLKLPGSPTLSPYYSRWSNFRTLAERENNLLANIGCVYIRMVCYRKLALSIHFSKDSPTTIRVHRALYSLPMPLEGGHTRFYLNPIIKSTYEAPTTCSVAWIESLITSVRIQCDQVFAETNYYPLHEVLTEMHTRRPHQRCIDTRGLGLGLQLRPQRSIDAGLGLGLKLRSLGDETSYPPKRITMKELNRLQREREIELKRSEDEEWWKQRRGTTERSRRLANEDGERDSRRAKRIRLFGIV